ncbi:hypothetical protein J0X15_18790 [Roseibium sp. CAU 1637]|uniref:Uncharacterized protein n=1 Tax=Roseibium limicola TaxID=2816037 RepID=A0A939EUD5_9HYPH|nr:hypothetical protein [Roseibium limicola]MBO0347284.1 hypothetical protein [Roseibium limicola]
MQDLASGLNKPENLYKTKSKAGKLLFYGQPAGKPWAKAHMKGGKLLPTGVEGAQS